MDDAADTFDSATRVRSRASLRARSAGVQSVPRPARGARAATAFATTRAGRSMSSSPPLGDGSASPPTGKLPLPAGLDEAAAWGGDGDAGAGTAPPVGKYASDQRVLRFDERYRLGSYEADKAPRGGHHGGRDGFHWR
ncbi:hypothetical protein MSPP1_002593 [Malassezia sp. CBS 17886]|nr:hypothetical protein MSPP1_002593 [Malassezia sp. CBS 17886]